MIAEVLEDAAEYIEEYGWAQVTQASTWTPGKEACVLAAINAAEGRNPELMYNLTRAGHAFAKYIPTVKSVFYDESNEERIWRWNDVPERTRDEVLTALRKAAEEERKLASVASKQG